MVLLGRIELPTSSLPMTRSTTELQQQLVPLAEATLPDRRGLWLAACPLSRHGLSAQCLSAYHPAMDEKNPDPAARAAGNDRAARLAEQLRANLRKRKAQARGAGEQKPVEE